MKTHRTVTGKEPVGDNGVGRAGVDARLFPPEAPEGGAGERLGGAKGWNRGRSSFKAVVLGLVLIFVVCWVVVLVAGNYMRGPSRTEDPDSSPAQVSGTGQRLVMKVDPVAREVWEGQTDLKPLVAPGSGEGDLRLVRESLLRLEGRLSTLESRVEELNAGQELLKKEMNKSGSVVGHTVPEFPPRELLQEPAPAEGAASVRDGGLPPPAREEGLRYHVVAPGETLFRIGKMYDVSVNRLMEANGLGKGHILQPGQKILIPAP